MHCNRYTHMSRIVLVILKMVFEKCKSKKEFENTDGPKGAYGIS